MKSMKPIMVLVLLLSSALIISSCGKGSKETKGALNDKKVRLEQLKKEQAKLNAQITALEDEISKLDTSADMSKAKLVSIETIGSDSFSHYIDVQGKIDAQNVAMVAPQGQGGVVRSILVRPGQKVGKGQLILKLDDAIARQQVSAAQQQIGGIRAQLAQAQSIYERQQNLWKNNIGTEVQVLNAKTNVEALQSQLNAAQANVRLTQESANLANVYAAISGTIDVMNVKVGEYFSPQSAADPSKGIRIVNTGELKVFAQVPENYLGKVNANSPIRVTLPESGDRVIETTVAVVSPLIDPVSRSFFIEGRLKPDATLRPNQIARVQIRDYTNSAAITIPVNTLQTDDKGKYVLVAVNEGGKLRARRRIITVGELYNDRLEVKSGLASGDQVIVEGFQSLYDGQLITTAAK